MKISQTATEYLVILAVVIIIALIVVGVLGGIPSIGGGVSSQTANLNLANNRIGFSDLAVGCSYSTFTVSNTLANAVVINNVTLQNRTCTFESGSQSLSLGAGSSRTINCFGAQLCTKPNERHTTKVKINWKDSSTGASYYDEGLYAGIFASSQRVNQIIEFDGSGELIGFYPGITLGELTEISSNGAAFSTVIAFRDFNGTDIIGGATYVWVGSYWSSDLATNHSGDIVPTLYAAVAGVNGGSTINLTFSDDMVYYGDDEVWRAAVRDQNWENTD